MPLSNDERGWIMTCISGVACVLGASIICVDLIIRYIPGKRNFRIQDSDAFLSSALSLSFGVMLFSSLFGMLPSAKASLLKGGFSAKAAAWTLIACFLGGALGIQVISRILHRYMPTHVVDCEHTHDEGDTKEDSTQPHSHDHGHHHEHGHDHDHEHAVLDPAGHSQEREQSHDHTGNHAHESRPNHAVTKSSTRRKSSYFPTINSQSSLAAVDVASPMEASSVPVGRPTLQTRLSRTFSNITSKTKPECDCDGPCYGFSEPCGQECFKILQSRNSKLSKKRSLQRLHSGRAPLPLPAANQVHNTESTPLLQEIREESNAVNARHGSIGHRKGDTDVIDDDNQNGDVADRTDLSSAPTLRDGGDGSLDGAKAGASDEESHHAQHHHHVPTNAFMSIGLQTAIAIALHKLPEGFITYATNHANPKLGFSIFLALFIHNITEGFAMALPLYLAINSRWKAMVISSFLGGFSQPLGAGVAALWFKIAGKGDMAPGEGVYGAMFAATAGIMTAVALQLFSESLDLTHRRDLCMVFAFIGMGILGVSSALTA